MNMKAVGGLTEQVFCRLTICVDGDDENLDFGRNESEEMLKHTTFATVRKYDGRQERNRELCLIRRSLKPESLDTRNEER